MLFPLLFAVAAGTLQSEKSALAATDVFSAESQWSAIEASPRITVHVRTGGAGSSVVIGVKDGFAYALTAAHVVQEENAKITAEYFERKDYPGGRMVEGVTVFKSNRNIDAAILKIPIKEGDATPKMLKLIALGQRPKAFPFMALSVGCDDGFSARCEVVEVLAKRFVRRPERQPAFFWESRQVSAVGRSGGPLLDKDLQVLGVCAANRDGRGYFAYSDEIHAWVKQLKGEKLDWLWDEKAKP